MRIRTISPRSRVSGGVAQGSRITAQFEGASTGYRMGKKGLGSGHINGEMSRSLSALRQRSLNAVRNHAYAKTAATTHVDNMVGCGIVAKWPDPVMQALWDVWIKRCDADGLDNLYALQALVARECFVSGESLTRRRFRSPQQSKGVVPLRLQVISTRQLDEAYSDPLNNILQSIQFNGFGERVAYHLMPTAAGSGFASLNRIRIPAADVAHVFERLEAGQVRGVPELSAILVRLYELDEMQDAILSRAKVSALFGGFIQRKPGKGGVLPTESNVVAQAGSDEGDIGDKVGETEEGSSIESIRIGGLHYLDEDESIEFPDLPDIGANHVVWLKTELRASAKAVGLTYEQLTGDLEGVSLSAIRAGLLDFRRRIERLQWNLMIARWCEQVAMWFAEAAVMSGMASLADFWENPYPHLPKWIPPKFEEVDRLKSAMADLIEMRSGTETRRDKVAAPGNDIDEVDAQLKREQESELVLDSNPAKTDGSGALQTLLSAMLSEDEDAPLTKDKTQ